MSDAATSPSREGQLLIAKYRLEKLLGVGSMGEVYRARHLAIEKLVAIKLLRKEHARNEQVVARFLREAKAANMVSHRNVAQVIDVGQDDDGVPFIVQELLEGRDLSDMLKEFEFGMPVELALSLFLPITQAMAAVHAVGLVHRDLKPENIMLARVDGLTVPKVLDFGVSKMQQSASDVRLTGTNMIMGSPVYMCPEQIQKPQEVDARADVWALGVMLYEALTAQLPFDSNNISTLFIKICNGTFTPLDEVAHGVPQGVVDIVHQCLRVDRNRRFKDATALARALTQAAGRSPESVQQLRGGSLEMAAVNPEATAQTVPAMPRVEPASAQPPAPVAAKPTPVASRAAAPATNVSAPREQATPQRVSAAPRPASAVIAPALTERMSAPALVTKVAPKSRVPMLLTLLALTVILAGLVLLLLVTSAPPASRELPTAPTTPQEP